MMDNLDLHNKANEEDNVHLPCFILSTKALLK